MALIPNLTKLMTLDFLLSEEDKKEGKLCWECWGTGEVEVESPYFPFTGKYIWVKCPKCGGKGSIEEGK